MIKLKTNFTTYSVKTTDDNSMTIYSEFYDEDCHSSAGAKAETHHNYILGCDLTRFCNPDNKEVHILEIGLGTGTGLFLTMDYFKKQKYQGKVNFTSLEIDEGLIDYLIKENSDKYDFLKNLKPCWQDGVLIYFFENESLKIQLIIGDATKTLPQLQKSFLHEKYQAIYQDAFSPKKNQELWTQEWFEILKKSCSLNVILATYSAAGSVRRALNSAGFITKRIQGYHLKKHITIATIGV